MEEKRGEPEGARAWLAQVQKEMRYQGGGTEQREHTGVPQVCREELATFFHLAQ
jgi:hypothetical protein